MNVYKTKVESVDGFLSRESKIIATKRRVGDIELTSAVLGGLWAPDTPAKVYNAEWNLGGNARSFQLQARCADFLKCVHVTLSQVGDDVAARVDAAVYTPCRHRQGYKFPKSVPVAATPQDNGYGISRLFFTTSRIASTADILCLDRKSFCGFLSAQETVVAHDVDVRHMNITGATLGGAWAPDTEAGVKSVERTESEMSVYLQANCFDYLKCVHVTLRQTGKDVSARVDWAAAMPTIGCSPKFDFSEIKFIPIATNAGEDGYGVAGLSFSSRPMCEVEAYVYVDEAPTIQVEVKPLVAADKTQIRIGLHWLREDRSYGGYVDDKTPVSTKQGCYKVLFSLDEIAQKVAGLEICPDMFFPVVFFTPDGSFDNAWFKTDLPGAMATDGMVVSLFKYNHSILKKKVARIMDERRAKAIREAAYVYIDGNNFCWDDDDAKGDSRKIGIARIDFVLKKLKDRGVSMLPENAKVKLFFDGGMTHGYRKEALERLNDGNVLICDREADRPMLDESVGNGATEKTIIVSMDGYGEYTDYSVVREGRVVRPEFDNCTIRIPGLLKGSFDFNPQHWAHLPVKHLPFAGYVFIKANSNGKFLCADDQGQADSRQVLANRTSPSEWERFSFVQNDDGTVSIKAKVSGKYLTSMADSDGRLVALADKIDLWEKFWLTKHIKKPFYILRSHATMKYVTVFRDGGFVAAQADVADEWEWMSITRCWKNS